MRPTSNGKVHCLPTPVEASTKEEAARVSRGSGESADSDGHFAKYAQMKRLMLKDPSHEQTQHGLRKKDIGCELKRRGSELEEMLRELRLQGQKAESDQLTGAESKYWSMSEVYGPGCGCNRLRSLP